MVCDEAPLVGSLSSSTRTSNFEKVEDQTSSRTHSDIPPVGEPRRLGFLRSTQYLRRGALDSLDHLRLVALSSDIHPLVQNV